MGHGEFVLSCNIQKGAKGNRYQRKLLLTLTYFPPFSLEDLPYLP